MGYNAERNGTATGIFLMPAVYVHLQLKALGHDIRVFRMPISGVILWTKERRNSFAAFCLALRLNAFSRTCMCKRVSRLQYTFSV